MELLTLLADFLTSCNHVDDTISVDLLRTYCTGLNDRDSSAAVESIALSTQFMPNYGQNQLQMFKYRSIPDANRPEFLSFQFNEVDLENALRTKLSLPQGFDTVLSDLVQKLSRARSIIFAVHTDPD